MSTLINNILVHDGGDAQTIIAKSWNPSALTTCQGWYRADQQVTLVSGKASVWNDLSGNGRHLTQGTGGSRPTFVASGIGGQASLSFAGSQLMDCGTGTWGAALAIPYTLYVIGYSAQDAFRTFTDRVDASGNRPLMYVGTSTRVFIDSLASDLTGHADVSVASLIIGAFNGATSHIYVNNSQTSIADGSTGAGTTLPSLRVGAFGGAGSNFLNGQIAEIIVDGALTSAATRELIANYVRARYQIATL